jgi:hypothetical protein
MVQNASAGVLGPSHDIGAFPKRDLDPLSSKTDQ